LGGLTVSRRQFLKIAGSLAGVALSSGLFAVARANALPQPKAKLVSGTRIPSICTYCAAGCGVIATAIDGRVVDVSGDPEHPINEGKLCSKAQALLQLYPQHRSMTVEPLGGSSLVTPRWEYRSLRLTRPLKRTNPRKGVDEDPGWQEITWEEAFQIIISKAREVVEEFYRRNPLPDKDGNYIVAGRSFPVAWIGSAYSSNEECYLFKKFTLLLQTDNIDHQARRCHSTTVTALAPTYGFGAMTNHVIDVKNAKVILIMGANTAEQHPTFFRWVMKAKENGAKLIVLDPRFTRSASKADIFVWFRPGTDAAVFLGLINYAIQNNLVDWEYVRARTDAEGIATENRKVIEELKRVASAYTVEEVSRITGIPPDKFVQIAETYCRTRPGTWLYAMGTTQHTNGTQMIRAGAILQLLLGNVGVPGGGVNATRGINNVQGSTDMNVIPGNLLGYRRTPTGASDIRNFQKYKNLVRAGKSAAEIAKELKIAWVGDLRHWASWHWALRDWGIFVGTYPEDDPDRGTVISDLPYGVGSTSIEIYRRMKAGEIKLLFVVGENPVVSHANALRVMEALSTPGTFTVVMDLFYTETAHFADILLPAASKLEAEGTVTNTGRWIQWRHRTQDPAAAGFPDIKTDLWFVDQLFKRFRRAGILILPSERFARDRGIDPRTLYTDSKGKTVDDLWNYGDPPDYERVLMEINRTVRIYMGVFAPDGRNRTKSRDKTPIDEMDRQLGFFKNWAFSWPDNQRVLYMLEETGGKTGPLGNTFFTPDARARIYLAAWAARGFAIPVHNEPVDSPSPALAQKYPRLIAGTHPGASPLNDPAIIKPADPREYPIILTTFRLTEQMHTGQLTRNLPWLRELNPDNRVEMSEGLAAKLGVKTGDLVVVKTPRNPAGIKVKAHVTNRVRPLVIDGREFEVVAMPFHWGFRGPNPGAITNTLTTDAADFFAAMPETKVALCRIERVG